MSFKNKLIVTFGIAVLGLGATFGTYVLSNNGANKMAEANVDTSELPIFPTKATFVIDVDNPNEKVGFVDYVFVGKVVKNHGTVYEDKVTMEDENGGKKEIGAPYTKYDVEVIENIKGNLKKNIPIEIWKDGGVSPDKKAVYVFENDELPAENKYYIFLGNVRMDGSILISSPNSNIPLNISDEKEIVLSHQYKKYQEAFKNQIVFERERSTSKFEE